MSKITTTPCLWFDGQSLEAAEFYTSLFDDGKIIKVARWPEGTPNAGAVLTVEFEFQGQRFVGLDGGPQFPHTEAISFQLGCDGQDEVDRLWDAFIVGGGGWHACGWLKDRFGVSWQIIPNGFVELITDPDPARAKRAIDAMHQMVKLDLAEAQAAADAA